MMNGYRSSAIKRKSYGGTPDGKPDMPKAVNDILEENKLDEHEVKRVHPDTFTGHGTAAGPNKPQKGASSTQSDVPESNLSKWVPSEPRKRVSRRLAPMSVQNSPPTQGACDLGLVNAERKTTAVDVGVRMFVSLECIAKKFSAEPSVNPDGAMVFSFLLRYGSARHNTNRDRITNQLRLHKQTFSICQTANPKVTTVGYGQTAACSARPSVEEKYRETSIYKLDAQTLSASVLQWPAPDRGLLGGPVMTLLSGVKENLGSSMKQCDYIWELICGHLLVYKALIASKRGGTVVAMADPLNAYMYGTHDYTDYTPLGNNNVWAGMVDDPAYVEFLIMMRRGCNGVTYSVGTLVDDITLPMRDSAVDEWSVISRNCNQSGAPVAATDPAVWVDYRRMYMYLCAFAIERGDRKSVV